MIFIKQWCEMIEVTLIDHMGSDLTTVNSARVSFGKKSQYECKDHVKGIYELKEADKKLIKYLGDHEHISPFGHSFASFHVKAPIFVARQLVKHKFLRFNEVSRRYVTTTPELYFPNEWREKAEDKKQGSGGPMKNSKDISAFVQNSCERLVREYEALLECGVAPEQARMILPQNLMTEWYWSGSLDAFADMYVLRTGEGAQEETTEVAKQIGRRMEELYPTSWRALVYES